MREFTVIKPNGRKIKVVAEYVRIEQGALVFRNSQRCGYPYVVLIVANCAWREVR